MSGGAKAASAVIGIMAAILASLHMRTVGDLFGGPPRQPTNRPVDRCVGAMGEGNSWLRRANSFLHYGANPLNKQGNKGKKWRPALFIKPVLGVQLSRPLSPNPLEV